MFAEAKDEEIVRRAEKLQLLRVSEKARRLEWELCRQDMWHWLSEWVYTLDEHDAEQPLKRFPQKEYLRRFAEVWQANDRLLVPKSRQMMITWACVAFYTHMFLFADGRRIAFQSKKEEDADALCKRSKIILDSLPSWMSKGYVSTYTRIQDTERNCMIQAVPQGGDQLRSYTFSGIFSDESAFQDMFEEAYRASKPTISSGGKLTVVSSMSPGYFAMLVKDRIQVAQ